MTNRSTQAIRKSQQKSALLANQAKPNELRKVGQFQLGPYKGYLGMARYDNQDGDFLGEVIGTRDVITFEGSFDELEQEFIASVETYLSICQEQGKEPDKPFSGKFMLRIPEELHRRMSIQAEALGISLNQLVIDSLENRLSQLKA